MKQMCNYKKAGMMMLAQLVSLGAFAFDAEVNGIYYNLNAKTKEACVTTGDEWSEEYVRMRVTLSFLQVLPIMVRPTA